MVAREPATPVTVGRLGPAARETLETQPDVVHRRLLPGEELSVCTPDFVPSTRPAVAGYAEAYGVGIADEVRALLFDAYWQQGADISSQQVLRVLRAEPIRCGNSTAEPLRRSGQPSPWPAGRSPPLHLRTEAAVLAGLAGASSKWGPQRSSTRSPKAR